MNTSVTRFLTPYLAAMTFAMPALANDWPQWRGPERNNVSGESGWSSVGQERPLWRADIGRGYSSPAIADGRLYIAGYFENPDTPREGLDRVSCLELESGAEIWSDTYPTQAYDNEHRGGALSTPTVVGDTVFVATRGGEVRAYGADDGTLRWRVDLVERHQVEPGRYGFASSPYVFEDMLVLNASGTVALEQETGETVWFSGGHDANYSTVAEISLADRLCFAVFGGTGLVLLDGGTGEPVHTYVFRNSPRNVEGATPLVMGERVIVSTAYEQGIALIDFSGDEPVEVWRNRTMRTKMAGTTLFEGHLYGFDESMLKCMDLEGNEKWRRRGLGHGALTIADGRLLVTSSDGELIVATATPEEYREEYRRPVIDGGVFWTGPILADGRILVRGSVGDLVCLDHRRAGSALDLAGASAGEGAQAPSPSELEQRYRKAAAFDAKEVEAMSLSGKLYNDSLGLSNVAATWEQGAGGLWHSVVQLPFGDMQIERYFDGELGWEVNPYRGDKLVEGKELAEMQHTDGFGFLFDPLDPKHARTIGREVFRGTPCWRVDVQLGPDRVRSVFFDAQTGLLSGRTNVDEATVVFGGWRAVEGRKFPFHRTEFHPETGEESRWRFDAIAFEPFDTSAFVVPEALLEEQEEASGDGEG